MSPCKHTGWAGTVAALLLGAALLPRPAHASPAPAPTVAPAASVDEGGMCIKESLSFGAAVGTYINAWDEYNAAVIAEDPKAILAAATRIDQATLAVIDTGLLLIKCLAQYL